MTPVTFVEFWSAYPRRVSKHAAFRAWTAAVKKTEPESILHALEESKREWAGRELKFIPYPATWLRATDFDDEFEAQEDDKEMPTLFKDEELRTRAQLLLIHLQRELDYWLRERAEHRHTTLCRFGELCKYSDSKRPRVPDLDAIMAHMRGK